MLPEFWDEVGGHSDRLRYACCGLVVVVVFGLVAVDIRPQVPGSVASESEPSILVDLPPTLASFAPKADQMDAPEIPPPAAPVTPEARSEADASPVPPIASPAAHLPPPEPPKPKVDTPEEPPAPPDATRQAQVLGGSVAPALDAAPVEAEPTRRASAKAIARWQQAMVAKLEAAKHRPSERPRDKGIVEIAFAIDRGGRLLRRAVTKSSGSRNLDALALQLIDAAAPFAPPPAAMGDAELAFTIPIRFNTR